MNPRTLGLVMAAALTSAILPLPSQAATAPAPAPATSRHDGSAAPAHRVEMGRLPRTGGATHTFLDAEHQEKRVLGGRAEMVAPQKKGQPWVHVDLVEDPGHAGPLHHKSAAQTAVETATTDASAPAAPGSTTAQAGTATPAGVSDVPGVGTHVAPDCSGTTTGNAGNRVQVVYAHEQGLPDLYANYVDGIKNVVAEIDDVFASSARQTNGGRRVRWVQDGSCSPRVLDVALPAGSLGADPNVTFRALSAAGYTSPARKYLVFADYSTMLFNGGAAGVGQLYLSDAVTGNPNDGGYPALARVDVWSVDVAGHELMHTLGAVQDTSPHHTDNGHCTDGTEMMCYADGSSQPYSATVCADANWADFDCNHDDYFSTSPAPGSYLSSHFNVASSTFLADAATLPGQPVVTVTADRTTVRTGETLTLTAASDRPVTYAWSSDDTTCAVVSNDTAQTSIAVSCPASTSRDITYAVRGTDAQGLYAQATMVVHVHPDATFAAIRAAGAYPTTFTGTLTDATGALFPGQPMSLRVQWYATTGWQQVATGTTNASGQVSATYAIGTQAGRFAWVYEGDGTHAASTSATTGIVKVPTQVAGTVKVGRPNVLRAVARSASGATLSGVALTLQRRYAGTTRWVSIATVRTSSTGVATSAQTPRRRTSYRWVLPTTATLAPATSNTVSVRR